MCGSSEVIAGGWASSRHTAVPAGAGPATKPQSESVSYEQDHGRECHLLPPTLSKLGSRTGSNVDKGFIVN